MFADAQTLSYMTRAQADQQPYGIVKLDDDGNVQMYNRWESEMAGVEPMAAEGRNFFTQVAPCTNNRLVFGKFKEGVANGSLDLEYNYTFTYKMRPTNVKLRILCHAPGRSHFVLVSKR